MPSRSGKQSGNTRRGAGRRKTTGRSSGTSREAQPGNAQSPMSKPKKRRPSFDIARPDGSETRAAGWVYRSDQPSNGTPEAEAASRPRTEVEFIPPGRGTLRRVPPPPAERPLIGLPLSALSFGA